MRQRIAITLTIIAVVGILVVINTASRATEEKPRDSEMAPIRSTYHAGPTGMRALYELLSESGYKVIRWRKIPEKLLSDEGKQVQTFVVVGSTQLPFTDDEAKSTLRWVERGGRLVLVDRSPQKSLLPPSEDWRVQPIVSNVPGFSVDPANPKDMTENVTAVRPQQLTTYTASVQSVMPSRFASRLLIKAQKQETANQSDAAEENRQHPNIPPSMRNGSPAPVVHVGDADGAVIVDYPHGAGRIVVITDPYLISNGGISLKDNLQVAINTMTSNDGLIAFDEYHQGRGATQNAFASYFAGTPVIPIAVQIALLVLVIIWTASRRFARPLPLPQVDRRSTLEFVASMAELQERSRAFDLALENIYSRSRRVLARYGGLDYNSSRAEIAQRVALRSSVNEEQLEKLMRQCEETINGAPTNWRTAIELVTALRSLERTLGLGMRSRDVRQAAENI
ncbi:MAG: DUF4350 domain-containing protein [Pyrinomonadaceae bacterium]